MANAFERLLKLMELAYASAKAAGCDTGVIDHWREHYLPEVRRKVSEYYKDPEVATWIDGYTNIVCCSLSELIQDHALASAEAGLDFVSEVLSQTELFIAKESKDGRR